MSLRPLEHNEGPDGIMPRPAADAIRVELDVVVAKDGRTCDVRSPTEDYLGDRVRVVTMVPRVRADGSLGVRIVLEVADSFASSRVARAVEECPRCALRSAEADAAANCVCSAGTHTPTTICAAHRRLAALRSLPPPPASVPTPPPSAPAEALYRACTAWCEQDGDTDDNRQAIADAAVACRLAAVKPSAPAACPSCGSKEPQVRFGVVSIDGGNPYPCDFDAYHAPRRPDER